MVGQIARLTAQSTSIGAGIGWVELIPFSDITGMTGEREVIDLSMGDAGIGGITPIQKLEQAA